MTNPETAGAYDVVIVGGGTAGCVLAARLSEDSGRSVCLIEAGPDYPGADRPHVFRSPWGEPVVESEYFWAYQARFHRSHETPTFTVRGRVTGGSSAINGAEFVRGLADDYDSWGSEKWSFGKVLESFKRAESDKDFDSDVHGHDGPIPVRRFPRETWSSLHCGFYDAAVGRGIPEKADANRSEGFGVSSIPMNIDSDGTRVDSARAYLDPARERPNLTVIGDTVVTRLLWDGDTVRGVEIDRNGERGTVDAGEVILSAGALASPHLLMVSGVGPADDLRAIDVSLVADVPGVGRNFQDHPSISMNLRLSDAVDTSQVGPSSPVILSYTAEGSELRNDMLLSLPWYRGNEFMPEVLSFSCRLNLPVSKGFLRLESGDINEGLTVEYCYLEAEEDRKRMREGVRFAVELTRMPEFASQLTEVVDAPSDDELASDAKLDQWLERNIASVLHSAGTCKMGEDHDGDAVVDDQCRVRGVHGVRVADLSIAPFVPRSNTGSTAIMIGEHLSAMMRGSQDG
jgi:choline dehydrogenase